MYLRVHVVCLLIVYFFSVRNTYRDFCNHFVFTYRNMFSLLLLFGMNVLYYLGGVAMILV